MLRHDTLRIIDGAEPNVEAEQASSETQAKQVTQSRSRKKAVSQPVASVKCMFSGIVPTDLNRFVESGVALVECPNCGRAWTLSPSGGVLRFKSHDKRKMNTPIPDDGGPGRKGELTGMWSEGKECSSRLCLFSSKRSFLKRGEER